MYAAFPESIESIVDLGGQPGGVHGEKLRLQGALAIGREIARGEQALIRGLGAVIAAHAFAAGAVGAQHFAERPEEIL